MAWATAAVSWDFFFWLGLGVLGLACPDPDPGSSLLLLLSSTEEEEEVVVEVLVPADSRCSPPSAPPPPPAVPVAREQTDHRHPGPALLL